MNATDREQAQRVATALLTACLPQAPHGAAADVVTAGFRCWTPIHDWESGVTGLAALRQVMSVYAATAPGADLLPVQALVTDGERVVVEAGPAGQPGQPPATTTFVLLISSGKVGEVRCYLDPEVSGWNG
jgi:hypothetical protein